MQLTAAPEPSLLPFQSCQHVSCEEGVEHGRNLHHERLD